MKERRLINAAIDIHLTPDTQVECRKTTSLGMGVGFGPVLTIGDVREENARINIWTGIDRLRRIHQVVGAYLAAHDLDDDDAPDGSSDRVDVVPAEAVAASDDLPPGWVRDLDDNLRHPSGLLVMPEPYSGHPGRPCVFDLYDLNTLTRTRFPSEADALRAAEAIIRADSESKAEAVAAAEDLPPGWVRDDDGDLRHPSGLLVMSADSPNPPGAFDLFHWDDYEVDRIGRFPSEAEAIGAAEAILRADVEGMASTYEGRRAALFAPGDVP